jgi:hypothetical protein
MSRLSLRRAVTLVLFAAVFESSLASVLAVDYGLDWITASLMNLDEGSRVPVTLLWCVDGGRKKKDITENQDVLQTFYIHIIMGAIPAMC